jgi:hypothetical protein
MFHSGLAGPQVMLRHHRFTSFARGLFGAARAATDRGGASKDTGFAWGVGGGLDWRAFERASVRLIQADYIRSRDTGLTRENLRLSFGLVFRF